MVQRCCGSADLMVYVCGDAIHCTLQIVGQRRNQGWVSQKYLWAGWGQEKLKYTETKKYERKVLVIHLHEKSCGYFIGIFNLWTNFKLCVYLPSVLSNKSFWKLSSDEFPQFRFSGSPGTHFLLLFRGVFSPCFPLVQMCTGRIKSLVMPHSMGLLKELSTPFLIT